MHAQWVLVLAAVGSCGHASLSTDTSSRSLPTPAARVAFLARYVTMPSAARDAAFRVVYHDNQGGAVPGPSDYDITAAILVEPADAPRWFRGPPSPAGTPVSNDWSAIVPPGDARFVPGPDARVFDRGERSRRVVDVQRGLVLIHAATSP